jgi:hypothetical protein
MGDQFGTHTRVAARILIVQVMVNDRVAGHGCVVVSSLWWLGALRLRVGRTVLR